MVNNRKVENLQDSNSGHDVTHSRISKLGATPAILVGSATVILALLFVLAMVAFAAGGLPSRAEDIRLVRVLFVMGMTTIGLVILSRRRNRYIAWPCILLSLLPWPTLVALVGPLQYSFEFERDPLTRWITILTAIALPIAGLTALLNKQRQILPKRRTMSTSTLAAIAVATLVVQAAVPIGISILSFQPSSDTVMSGVRMEGYSGPRCFLVWSPDGSKLACWSTRDRNLTIAVWDAASGQHLYTLDGGRADSDSVIAWSPDVAQIAAQANEQVAV
jgi:WD40 repeat protein